MSETVSIKDLFFRTFHDDLGKPDPLWETYVLIRTIEQIYSLTTIVLEEATGQLLTTTNTPIIVNNIPSYSQIVIDGQAWIFDLNIEEPKDG